MTTRHRSWIRWLVLGVCGLTAVAAVVLHAHWLPAARRLAGLYRQVEPFVRGHADRNDNMPHAGEPSQGEDDHAAHDPVADDPVGRDRAGDDRQPYGHAHDEAAALRLSKQAEASIGLDLHTVEVGPFARTIGVPALIVRRPGRSEVLITAPFTGLVTRIYRVEGEAVTPGVPLFDLQLTHEELVEAQADFLRIAEELEVVKREVARVAEVVAKGAVAGKSLLERQYEQQKLEASLHAQHQRLLLHRLTPRQVDGILRNRKLLQDLTVAAPLPPDDGTDHQQRMMQVQELRVKRGQHVAAGDPLCTLADYAELHVRGKAFEQDIPVLAEAAERGWPVTAVFPSPDNGRTTVADLKILYLANEVETDSRAFYFYAVLPNQPALNAETEAGQRFIGWKYRPGQRLRLLVPIEAAENRIVLPVESVVRDGVETYAYEYNQDHFDRRAVRVEHRDQDRVVIANDGSLEPGARVAVSGAYQIHLATKNKNSGPVDPHAGHGH